MKLFDNPKAAVIAIVIIIGLFFAYKANATEFEIGLTYAGEFNGGTGIVITESVADGKIDIGIALIGEQTYDKENLVLGNNGNVFFAFCARRPGKWSAFLPDVCIGAAYWIQTSRFIGDELGYHLALKWHITEHASIGVRHWSNAGTVKPNRGQDLITFGWSF